MGDQTATRVEARREAGEPARNDDHVVERLLEHDEHLRRSIVLLATTEMAGYLQEHLGQRLTAYLAGIKDPKTVGQWSLGRAEPSAITRERLRAAYHATALLAGAHGDVAAQGWFFGANAALDDSAPAAVLRTADTPEQIARIAPLARAFVRGAL